MQTIANLSQYTQASLEEKIEKRMAHGDMGQPGIIPRAALQCQCPEIQNDVDGTPRYVPFQVPFQVPWLLDVPDISIRFPWGQSHWLPTACIWWRQGLRPGPHQICRSQIGMRHVASVLIDRKQLEAWDSKINYRNWCGQNRAGRHLNILEPFLHFRMNLPGERQVQSR